MNADEPTLIEITSGLRFPEGPVATADGSVLVVEIFGPRITRVAPDGTKTTLAEVPGGPNGNICVGTLVNGGVTVISPEGEVIDHVATGDLMTTNICFGGPDLTTAFITASATGRLVSMTWPRPGLALAHRA